MSAIIRKIVTVVEETHLEMGQTVSPPTRRAAAIAVIENPFAGRYVEDLSPLIAIGEELGELLSKRAVAALGIDGAKAQSYGKAAAVGENGELEHAAATIIANAVDLPGHPAIIRKPANELQSDSDLGARLVTRDVSELSQDEIATALESGAECARQLFDRGLIEGAVLQLCGDMLVIGPKDIERQRSRPPVLDNAVHA